MKSTVVVKLVNLRSSTLGSSASKPRGARLSACPRSRPTFLARFQRSDRSTIANTLRLLELPTGLQQDVEEGRISTGHAKALLAVSNPERRRHVRDRIVRDHLSVRAAEEIDAARKASTERRVSCL